MSASDIIKRIEDYACLTTRALAQKIGLNQAQTFYDIHKGKVGISIAVAKKIVATFPEIRLEWVLTGEGAMLREGVEEVEEVQEVKPTPEVSQPLVGELPILPVQTFRAADTDAYDYIQRNYDAVNKFRVSKVLKHTDMIVMTSNDSMMPTISPTDYLFVHKLAIGAKITDGEVYYIDTKSQGGLVRRFTYDPTIESYIGRAENSAAFPDAVVHKDDVSEISAILCMMRFVMPSTKACDHGEQLRENNNHIASLIEQIDKSGERVDKLIDLLASK